MRVNFEYITRTGHEASAYLQGHGAQVPELAGVRWIDRRSVDHDIVLVLLYPEPTSTNNTKACGCMGGASGQKPNQINSIRKDDTKSDLFSNKEVKNKNYIVAFIQKKT